MAPVREEELQQWGAILVDPSQSLGERFKALFGLRHASELLAIQLMSRAFADSSALLKHEVAYCLGQKQDVRAIPYLVAVLQDSQQEPIVRHEAAEALGAIGASAEVLDVLREYEASPIQEIAETCTLAIRRLQWLEEQRKSGEGGGGDAEASAVLQCATMQSIDPAPSLGDLPLAELRDLLLNEEESLFQRYRAMFTLRNKIANAENVHCEETVQLVLALAQGLQCPGSALFRHEVAFVLGQIAHTASVPALRQCLANGQESGMVRHECAEALGSIGGEECEQLLQAYLVDSERVVRESCIVALDISEYQQDPSQFHYAKVPTVD